MRTLVSFIVVLFAAFMVSCGGNANKPKEVVEETVEVVDSSAVCTEADSTKCSEECKCAEGECTGECGENCAKKCAEKESAEVKAE